MPYPDHQILLPMLLTVSAAIAKFQTYNLIPWRRYGLAWVLGLIAALAFPPFNFWPLLFIAFPLLLKQLQVASKSWQAFALGWCFAFAMLTVNLYWIAGALFVDIGTYWWVLPFAVLGLPALFAIYYGIAAWLAMCWGLQRASGVILFGLLWFLADFARGHLFTGFPWAILGYVWSDYLPLMQVVSLIGIYGLSLLTAVLVVLPALLLRRSLKAGWLNIAAVILVLSALAGWGAWRLGETPAEMVPGVRLRIVQTNTDQSTKWLKTQREANFAALLDNTFAPGEKPITHYIWPETATPFYLMEESERRRAIAARMEPDSLLLTGIVRRYPQSDGTYHYYNSLIAMDARATIVAGYDKFHLVPFGEYFPFRDLLALTALTAIGADFSFGEGLRTLRVAGLPLFSPLICYEAIFPGDVKDSADPPQLLLNVTNDAWYQHTTGPYQHFLIARTRAIEEGLPMIRVANKGTTAVIDPLGRSVAELGMDQATFADSDLPKALPAPTYYSHHGNRLTWVMAVMILAIACGLRLFYRKE